MTAYKDEARPMEERMFAFDLLFITFEDGCPMSVVAKYIGDSKPEWWPNEDNVKPEDVMPWSSEFHFKAPDGSDWHMFYRRSRLNW
jgi:hypothetical protein